MKSESITKPLPTEKSADVMASLINSTTCFEKILPQLFAFYSK